MAYRCAEAAGIPLWCQDEAGPYQTVPYPGERWRPEGDPLRQPHEYLRAGTAKLLTLLRPATGEVRGTGATRTTNAVLHPWVQAEMTESLATLPTAPVAEADRPLAARWATWLGHEPRDPFPPLRLILVWDNLAGHLSWPIVDWLFQHGVMPLYAPLSGSWLNLPKGHPQNRCNGLLVGAPSRGSIRRRRKKSSRGWKRRWRDGITHRQRSFGEESGRRGESGRDGGR
ncbi:MAG: transposase [Thermomicrobiales bacterium]